ncbi:MAG TPA: O-antigen ligase family protein [Chthoniobacterales bacterium]|jgi:O-antigen ligase|nr:O-antigen ligase family protein [Chthoniobacterales bacterium]
MVDQPSESQQQRRPREEEETAWLASTVIALLPALACFLGGATSKWAEGIVVALLGLYLLLRPPRVSLGLLTNAVLFALIALSAAAFLPAAWFYIPAWRVALTNELKMALPPTVSLQPWITASYLISLVAGVSWLYLVSTQDIGLRAVRWQLRLFVVGIVVLAAFSVAFYMAHVSPAFWNNQRGFGPFPNRNQTADLFGITAIVLLACGQDDLRFGRKRWLMWIPALGLLIAALMLNLSRAGLVILVGGSALWIAIVALRQRSPGWIALGVSFLLLLFSALLLGGGETLERFHLRGLQGFGISSDFRWLIFKDTFRMIAVSPWCGVGLGNFESAFALFRTLSSADTRSLHPESDWLWAWAELGWPAVIIILLGAALFIRRVFPLREGTNQRLRLAALIGAILFGLHGIIDVSAHRVGTAFSGLFLFGLTLHRPLALVARRSVAIVFRTVGVLLIVSGTSWVIAARGEFLLPGSVGVTNAKQLAAAANSEYNFAEAISVATRGLDWAPLDWQLYFTRALAEVADKRPELAIIDFRRASFLEPNGFEVPLAEGNAWLPTQAEYAANAFREALRRAPGARQAEVFAMILTNAAQQNPPVARMMEQIGLARHDLVLPYLNRVAGETFQRAVNHVLRNDPELTTFSEPEKFAMFTLWSERGDLDQLASTIQQHPNWTQYAWLGLAKYHAAHSDFRAAYELTQRYGEAVALPSATTSSSLEKLQKDFYSTPDNYAVGYGLYRAQVQAGRLDDALGTIRHFTDHVSAPAYFHFLEAQCWAAKQDWERAWKAWQKFRSVQTQPAR